MQVTPCAGCHARCDFENDREACYGCVQPIDEYDYGDDNWGWVHACEGHEDNGRYEPYRDTGSSTSASVGTSS